jgi:hypothetical protein
MYAGNNRVVEGMQDWMQRERNIEGLFSPSTLNTRYFLHLKLDYFRDLRQSIRNDANKEERMTMRILKGEMKQLEKRLHPSGMVRIVMHIARVIRSAIQRTDKPVMSQQTEWMMKIEKPDRNKDQSLKKAVAQPVEKQRLKPSLVQKTRVSSGKGLGLK